MNINTKRSLNLRTERYDTPSFIMRLYVCTMLCSHFKQRCPTTQPTSRTQRDIRRHLSRRHTALVAIADRTSGRQQPIQAENQKQHQQQLAAEQQAAPHMFRPAAILAAHGRRCQERRPTTGSDTSAAVHARRRSHRLCLVSCSSKQPCLLRRTPVIPGKYGTCA